MSRPVRVLIVDDSSTMRGLIAAVLAADAEIEVCGQAADPFEARQMIKALNPDVVTLDVEMPNMSGIEFLKKVMRLRPTPVIMVSAATQRGADITLEALSIGAVDCVGKPIGGVGGASDFAQLPAKVRAAARARVDAMSGGAVLLGECLPARPWDGRIVAIGSSTGGVEALGAIIPRLPANCPPVVVTQHMPATFTASLARRLDRDSAPMVSEARDGAPLLPGRVYIAPGGAAHLHVRAASGGGLECELAEGDPVTGHRPSVDALFQSVAQTAGAKAVGAILTGMGRDGALGLLAMRQAGAVTLGQDEATSVVYGMPKAAFELGAVQRQLPIHRMVQALLGHDLEFPLREKGAA